MEIQPNGNNATGVPIKKPYTILLSPVSPHTLFILRYAQSKDPEKRAKALKKKLKAIEALQARLDAGELKADALDKDQKTKLASRVDLEAELAKLAL